MNYYSIHHVIDCVISTRKAPFWRGDFRLHKATAVTCILVSCTGLQCLIFHGIMTTRAFVCFGPATVERKKIFPNFPAGGTRTFLWCYSDCTQTTMSKNLWDNDHMSHAYNSKVREKGLVRTPGMVPEVLQTRLFCESVFTAAKIRIHNLWIRIYSKTRRYGSWNLPLVD